MKIAISAAENRPDSLLDPRFGRCPYYAVFDKANNSWEFISNPGAQEGSGAGIKASQFITEQIIDVVLTGELGPNASRVLEAAGIKVFSLPQVPLSEALKMYNEGGAKLINEATVESHSGLNYNPGKPQGKTEGGKTRVSIATEGSDVAQHFGRCPEYTLVDIQDGSVVNQEKIPNPGHQPGFLPGYLAEKGVNCIIAGGMGPRAQNLFSSQGVDVIIGVTGPVTGAINSFLAGKLTGGESLCSHGEDGHSCDEQ